MTVDAAAVALTATSTNRALTAHVSIVATSSTTVKLTIVDARNSIRDLDTGELITVDELERRESARLSRGSSAFDLSAVSNNSSKALERRLRDVGDIVFMRHTVRDLDTGEIIDADELERRTPHPESAFDLSAVAPHRAAWPRAPQTAADDSPDAQAHRALRPNGVDARRVHRRFVARARAASAEPRLPRRARGGGGGGDGG